LDYGKAGNAVLNCDLPRYLAVLLRVAGIHAVSVAERNVAAATAYTLADEAVRQEAFAYSDGVPAEWSELLAPLHDPQVAACLFRDCCQVAWADGELDPVEQEVLTQIASELQLSDPLRDQILAAVEEQELARLRILALFS
jgi:hypothetical protein